MSSSRPLTTGKLWPSFAWIPTPRTWMAEWIRRRGLSQSALASRLAISPSQLNHILSGSEAVPAAHFHELASSLNPADLHHLPLLGQCEVLAKTLQGLLDDITSDNVSLNRAATVFRDKLQELIQFEIEGSVAYTKALSAHLGSAVYVLRQFRLLQKDLTTEVVSVRDIDRHLRFPTNHFVGCLLEVGRENRDGRVGELRRDTLTALRRLAKRWRRPNSLHEAFVAQHSVHLLARFGESGDEQFIDDLVTKSAGGLDPMTKRLAFVGLALRAGRRDVESMLDSMHTDVQIQGASLQFDAIHYGGIPITASGDALQSQALQAIIPHLLRHVLAPTEYLPIMKIEQTKVCDLLDRFGPRIVATADLRRVLPTVQHAGTEARTRYSPRFLAAVHQLAKRRHLKASLPSQSARPASISVAHAKEQP